ncbi:MAG: alkaline phosphatase family protein [Oscillospiraceae bacterium]|jgi:hypothetical protein|nr:alkaline phosphatase family protein [Oscillospiraceae bacterium]
MPIKTKKILRVIFLMLAAVALLLGLFFGGFWLSDRIYQDQYLQVLNKAEVFSAGQDATSPLPQTELAQTMLNHFNSPLPDGKTVKKALIIGLDGTRADALINAVNPAESGILTLKEQGGVYPVFTGGPEELKQGTWTASGWATLLTGKWALEDGGHKVSDNNDRKSVEPKTVLTRLVEDGKIKSADFIVSWNGHLKTKSATYANEANYTKDNNLPINWNTTQNDTKTFETAKAQIGAGNDFIFLILEYCDHVGHTSRFGNKNRLYREAFLTADADAKRLIDAVAERPDYVREDWLILITTDHGGTGLSHGGQSILERNVFVASNKPLV